MQKEIKKIIKLLRQGVPEDQICLIMKKKGMLINPSYIVSIIKGRMGGMKWKEDYKI